MTGSQTTHYRSISSQSRQHFSRFGQQDLYSPPIFENLLIYFFQYGPFGRGVRCSDEDAVQIAEVLKEARQRRQEKKRQDFHFSFSK